MSVFGEQALTSLVFDGRYRGREGNSGHLAQCCCERTFSRGASLAWGRVAAASARGCPRRAPRTAQTHPLHLCRSVSNCCSWPSCERKFLLRGTTLDWKFPRTKPRCGGCCHFNVQLAVAGSPSRSMNVPLGPLTVPWRGGPRPEELCVPYGIQAVPRLPGTHDILPEEMLVLIGHFFPWGLVALPPLLSSGWLLSQPAESDGWKLCLLGSGLED